MTIAYDYPLGSILLSVFWFFLFFAWLMALFHVFADIFRSHDMGGLAKAVWLIFVIALPFLGVFVYLIARGGKMTEHAVADAEAQDAALQSYVKQAAGTSGPGDQLRELVTLHDSGAISDSEYEAGKAKVLAV
jgi:hypothetical protein